MTVKPIPDGHHTVTPYLAVEGAAKLVEFMKEAFEAQELFCMKRPDGKIGHTELRIGDSVVMLAEACGEWKPMPAGIHLYVPDADAVYQRAVQAGATSIMPVTDQFYGDRSGGVKDPSGNFWWISTHKEDLSHEEISRRGAEHMKKQANGHGSA